MSVTPSNPHAVLVGAGHAHLHLARAAHRFRTQGCRVTLIDPNHFWYSGMATGMLGGSYKPQDDYLDPEPLMLAGGGSFLRDRVLAIDRTERLLQLRSGRSLRYDVLSLNVGSEVPLDRIPGAGTRAWPVKPISNLHRLRRYMETCFAIDCIDRIAVIGGGPTGCEIACNLAELARRHNARPRIILITRSPRLIPHAPINASRFLTRWMAELGIEVHLATTVERIEDRTLHTPDGSFNAELALIATGLRAPSFVRHLDLPLGDDGDGLLVDRHLQSPADDRVFAAGDCIAFGPRRLPRVGVFGVRQGPILLHNLIARLQGRPLQTFHPQRRFLAIMNIGRGHGLALRGRFWAHGRWCMRWKNYLDQRFMQKYRDIAAHIPCETR